MARARSTRNQPIAAGAAIQGVNATLRAFNKLGKDANKALKVKVREIAEKALQRTSAAGRGRGGRDAIVARSGKVLSDRFPVVQYGGNQKAGVSGGATMSQLVWGMEFGAAQDGPNGWRFPPRTPKHGRGNRGYWIFPTASTMQKDIADEWLDALDRIAKEWASG
jgi:hypothetical protein